MTSLGEELCYIILPAFILLLEQASSDRCDAHVIRKVTGEVFEEIH
jgi:hypothetical protein